MSYFVGMEYNLGTLGFCFVVVWLFLLSPLLPSFRQTGLLRCTRVLSVKQNKTPRLYVQVNTGLEDQKAGINPCEAVAFVKRCRDAHGLTIDGLMCIPPFDEHPGLHFALLQKLATQAGVEKLSMGMSADFEKAIPFGATSVRVGSAIFGSR